MAAFVPEPWRKTILGLSMVILMMFVVFCFLSLRGAIRRG
jgi:hypothetical protein